jgi:hypothetical protein
MTTKMIQSGADTSISLSALNEEENTFLFKKQRIKSGKRFSENLDNLHANLHVI